MDGKYKELAVEKIKSITTELLSCLKILINPKSYWIFLPIILAIVSVYIAYAMDAQWYLVKNGHEYFALAAMGAVVLTLIPASIRFKTVFVYFLLVLAVNFLIRELDETTITLPGIGSFMIRSKKYIYVALGFMAAWAVWKDKKIITFVNRYPLVKTMTIGVFITYFISLLISRRVFKHIPIVPHEKELHIAFEEVSENFAHMFFLTLAITVLCYSFSKKRSLSEAEELEVPEKIMPEAEPVSE